MLPASCPCRRVTKMSGYTDTGAVRFPVTISQIPLQQAVQLVVGPGPGQASVQISVWRRQQRLSDWQVPVVLVSGFVQGDPIGRGLHLPLLAFPLAVVFPEALAFFASLAGTAVLLAFA